MHHDVGTKFKRPTQIRGSDSVVDNHRHAMFVRHISQRLQIDHVRSEEHTSELQSRENLVCGLLLEKKRVYTAFDSSEVSVQRVYEYVSILELRVKPVACGLQTYALGAVEYTLQVES